MYLLICLHAEINTVPFYLGLYRAQSKHPQILIKAFAFCGLTKNNRQGSLLGWLCDSTAAQDTWLLSWP